MIIIVYTHSDMSWLWNATIGSISQFASDFDIIWLSNGAPSELPKTWTTCLYDETMTYTNRVKSVFKLLHDDEYFIFLHEDWMPCNNINKNLLYTYVTYLKSIDCPYLMSYYTPDHNVKNTCVDFNGNKLCDMIYPYLQPSLWRGDAFKSVFSPSLDCKGITNHIEIWLHNHNPSFRCLALHIGKSNTNLSPIFPHMHVIVKGKLTSKKYPGVQKFLENYGVTLPLGIQQDTSWLV